MKKIILSFAMVGVITSPLAVFAADPAQVTPTVTGATVQPSAGVTTQEKLLAKKLRQIKNKSRSTKQKININIRQSKAQISKVKKARTKVKKTRLIASRVKATRTNTTR